MKTTTIKVKIKDLVKQYSDKGFDGVSAYDGKLDIRPPYQREFVYDAAKEEAVIETILEECPISEMYWALKDDGTYEIVDGQQRTMSICRFVEGRTSYSDGNNSIRYFNLDTFGTDAKNKFDNYELTIHVIEGTKAEKLKYFNKINIAGVVLTKQELRNAVYAGEWLSDAKRYFSNMNQGAHKLSEKYVNGSPARQDILESALSWIADYKWGKPGTIEEYMAIYQHTKDATELKEYFKDVISWVGRTFPKYHKEMDGIEWGLLYNKYHDNSYDAIDLNKQIDILLEDDEVTKVKGIWGYVLGEPEKILSIRTFDLKQKSMGYARQSGNCAKCQKHFELNEMEADHITPWSRGGKTTLDNLQMLCKACNRTKSNI